MYVREHYTNRWHIARDFHSQHMLCGFVTPGSPEVRSSSPDGVCTDCERIRNSEIAWAKTRPPKPSRDHVNSELIAARVHLLRVRRLQTKAAENLESRNKELDQAIERYARAEEQFDNGVE